MAQKNYSHIGTEVLPFSIKENSFRARIASWVLKERCMAMVWSNTILLHGISAEQFYTHKAWLRHELKHIEQFRRHGFYSFLAQYLWETLRKGYKNNRFELEARNAEGEDIEQFYCLTPSPSRQK